MRMKRIVLALFALMAGMLVAAADDDRRWGRDHDRYRDNEGAPAAPEPAEVLLVAGGLTLAGVYIAWRRRKQRVQMPA